MNYVDYESIKVGATYFFGDSPLGYVQNIKDYCCMFCSEKQFKVLKLNTIDSIQESLKIIINVECIGCLDHFSFIFYTKSRIGKKIKIVRI